ncbi:DUF2510 domain-containing protein [Microlunatus soli]|uniref:DUF2510 domain-containing protein n=1 Tax=Microlunatus soli TaxID=630515 RepID=A0A1H1PNZ2_9ACTN|nr:DUF2510 domain-containing protein [Microlunatus soli]SDS12479.1 Protein of unknown function [Microlunatus soli]
MTAPLAGWYPDPSGAADFRWWDGTTWTDAISDTADVAEPQDARPVGSPVDHADAEHADAGPDQRSQYAGIDGPAEGHQPITPSDRAQPRGGRLVALLVAVSLVVSGGVVGLIGWRSYQSARSPAGSAAGGPEQSSAAGPQASSGPSPGGGSGSDAQADRSGRLDEVTRRASIGRATMTLPPAPYELVSDPVSIPHVFDAMFVANAPVHADYNGADTWASTVGIGHIPAEAWTDDDLPGFGRKALKGISEQFFGYTPTSVDKFDYHPVTVGSTACAELTANVHYAVKGLASKFDRVRIVGCPDGTDGSVVAAVSSVPDDASHQVSTLAERSLATFAVR